MDPFVRRLIERLHDPSKPLSRNRHFHTFDTREGRAALRVSRRLRSLAKDILACFAEGTDASFLRHLMESGEHRVELTLERLSGRRVSILNDVEFELLCALPGVADALVAAEGTDDEARTHAARTG